MLAYLLHRTLAYLSLVHSDLETAHIERVVLSSDDAGNIETTIQTVQTETYRTSAKDHRCHDFGDPNSTRKALLIGNQTYHTSTPLENPINDVALFERTLEQAGFSGRACTDLGRDVIEHEIVRFGTTLGPNDTSLTLLDGHGLSFHGENYFVGVDERGYAVEKLLTMLEKRKDETVNIVIIDACRNDPTEKDASNSGFSPEAAATGIYIAFASAPKKKSRDSFVTEENTKSKNSPFAWAFAQVFEEFPGLELDHMFRVVRARVTQLTKQFQTPWSNHALTGQFYFQPTSAATPGPVPAVTASPVPSETGSPVPVPAVTSSPAPMSDNSSTRAANG